MQKKKKKRTQWISRNQSKVVTAPTSKRAVKKRVCSSAMSESYILSILGRGKKNMPLKVGVCCVLAASRSLRHAGFYSSGVRRVISSACSKQYVQL